MTNWQKPRLTVELNQLAARLPETRWLALVDSHGRLQASFPDPLGEADRVSAMATAMLSLGERIIKELKGGELRYQLLGGTTSTILTVVLSKDYLLTLNLRPAASVDALFSALKTEISPLLQELQLSINIHPGENHV